MCGTAEHNSLVLDILVPRLDFHDATAEHYNNHADEMVECAIQHKVRFQYETVPMVPMGVVHVPL